MLEALRIVESRDAFLDISADEARELERLGTRLASRREWWGGRPTDFQSKDDDIGDRSVIKVVRLLDGRFAVRVVDAVGVISTGKRTIVVEPKIPVSHFEYIAKLGSPGFRTENSIVEVGEHESFWELVATWCVNEIELLLRRGLLSDYVEQRDLLKSVRGAPELVDSSRRWLVGDLRVECRFEEFVVDTPLNRLLREALRTIMGAPIDMSLELRDRARTLHRRMEGVGSFRAGDWFAPLDRRTAVYAGAVEFARRVVQGVGITLDSSKLAARAFLVRSPDVIEAGLRRLIAASLAPIEILPRAGARPLAATTTFSVNPDLVIARGRVTGDVKYKLALPAVWNYPDVHQSAAFGTAYEAVGTFVATFARAEFDMDIDFVRFPFRRICWSIGEEDPRVAAESFGSRVRKFVESLVLDTNH